MSDVVLTALIAAVGGIITAFVPFIIEIERQRFELRKRQLEIEKEEREAAARGGKGRKPAKAVPPARKSTIAEAPPRPKINWYRTGAIAVIAALILFTGRMIFISISAQTPPTPAVSLSAARVEFRMTGNDTLIVIPAGGTVDTLRLDDRINIETTVTDENGAPYPNPLKFTYYFASGSKFSGDVAPYLVRQSDTISVEIEDQATKEVITRFILVRPD